MSIRRLLGRFALFFLGIPLIVFAGGCQGYGAVPPSPVSSVTPVLPDGYPGDEIHTFGIIYPMANSFYERITEDAEKAARASHVRLIVKAPDEANLEQQIRMMETMIKQKVDGIAIDPIDAEALTPVIDKAVSSGIPVVCFESDAPTSKRDSFLGTDNKAAGVLTGKTLDQLLGGRGMVLVETGMSRTHAMQQRLEGMLDYLNEKTKIQVLEVQYHEGSDSRALKELEGMIDRHPHFDAFVGLDFVSGSTSVLVWKAMGLTRFAVTFGLNAEIREAMVNGQITAAISQNEEKWGGLIVVSLVSAAKGHELLPFVDTGVARLSANDLDISTVVQARQP